MIHHGSCHCGQVKFTVEGDFTSAIDCNCSYCSKVGALLSAVQRENLLVTSGEGGLATYLFNKHVIRHRFCRVCGVHPFAEGNGPDGKPMAMINLRCIDELDLAKVAVQPFDGRAR